ncbi:MAG: RNA methyltransferase [Clostridia bacterium]|nr:RNA methyltransferase [Clostridia bacterium]
MSTEFTKITSKDNSLIKLISQLNNSGRSRKEHGLFVIEGLRLCRDAAENGYEFETLVISETAQEKYGDDILLLLKQAKKAYLVTDSVFTKISDTKSPQGIICLVKREDAKHNIDPRGRYIALENVSDPSNLGAVARTAEAFDISGIIVSSNGCDPFAPKSLRASMGALLRLPVIVLDDFVSELKSSGLSLYACVVTEALSVTEASFADGCAALIGNEANGLTGEAIAAATPITIKMTGRAESLNAAVAASIVMWEMQR